MILQIELSDSQKTKFSAQMDEYIDNGPIPRKESESLTGRP